MEREKYHNKNLKEKLIIEGIKQINEIGIEAFSIRLLSIKCNISHNAPYRHFKNKQELIYTMQIHIEDKLTLVLNNVIDNSNPNEIIYNLGIAYISFFIDNPNFYHFMIHQNNIKIFFNQKDGLTTNYEPINLFNKFATIALQELNIPKYKVTDSLIEMLAIVHGITGMAIMSGVKSDSDWIETATRILKKIEKE